MITPHGKKYQTTVLLLFLFGILLFGIPAAGHFYYSEHRKNFREEVDRSLTAIGELKITEIAQWRKERLGDASVIYKNSAFSESVKEYLRHPNDKAKREQLLNWIKHIEKSGEYDRISLNDHTNTERLSFPDSKEILSTTSIHRSEESMKIRMMIFQDFYHHSSTHKIYLKIFIPILDTDDSTLVLGSLSLRIDPETYLYPLLKTWPGLSRTAETLLLRREGNDIVYLNDVRFKEHSALNYRIPMSDDSVAAVKAALGQKGIVDAIDYRHKPVLAYVNSIPNSPWFLVVRMDKDEVDEPLQERFWVTIIFVVIILVGTSSGAGLIWRTQRARSAQQLHAAKEQVHESEELFRHAFEYAATGICIVGIDTKFQRTNKAFREMIGYEEDELKNLTFNDITHPDDKPIGSDQAKKMLSGEIDYTSFEKRYVSKDKSTVWCYVSISLIRDVNLRPKYFITQIINITQRKQAEELLRMSEEKFRSVAQSAHDAIITTDKKGSIVDWNSGAEEMFGYRESEILGKQLDIIIPSDDLEQHIKQRKRSEQDGEQNIVGKTIELKGLRKNGTEFSLELSLAEWETSSGKYFTGIIRDITERKHAEESLVQEQYLMNMMMDNVPDHIYFKDLDSRFIRMNNENAKKLGFSNPTQVIGKTDFDFFTEEHARPAFEDEKRIIQTGEPIIGKEEKETWPDGRVTWASTTKMPLRSKEGNIIGTFGISHDITLRKQAEKQLALLAHSLKSITECVSITDMNDIILFVNNAFLTTYGYSEHELVGKNVSIVRSPNNPPEATRGILAATLAGGWSGELLNRTKDGIDFTISLSTSNVRDEFGQVIALVGVATDITNRIQTEEKEKSLEGQLRQAQKLESLGTLASGIAHDFNNILGIILGHSTLLMLLRNNPQKLSESVEIITKATQRGASLVKQLLTFARKADALFETVNINDMIKEINKLLLETIHKTINISISLQEDLPAIIADATQIHQVLLNLSVNARDAMPKGGMLSITTSTIEGESLHKQFTKITSRQYAKIEVTDTGIGMDEATRQRIFEPFFTTKGPGKGTGLGLSVVFGIVEYHKGFIDVRSTPGMGTCFSVYLPIPERVLEEIHVEEKSLAEIPGGTETILIIEDEAMLMELVKQSLDSKGYTVLTAEDGIRGIEIYESHQDQIALVLTDLGLPSLDGQDVFTIIRRINPKAKIIAASGFFDPAIKSEMFKAGLKNFIQKPYLIDEVLKKVRETIDSKG